MTKDVKGITWVGNIYQKFENMCLEVEDMMYEDTFKYIETQMQNVGASFKKLCSDVMEDLRPPSSCALDMVASELPTDQNTDAGLCMKSIQGSKERPVKADNKQTAEDSRINHDVDNDVIQAASYDESCEKDGLFMSASGNSVKEHNFISYAKQYVGSTDIKPNLGIDENQQNKKMPAVKTFSAITLSETDTCRASQSCELSNENQNLAATDSHPASAEVTRLSTLADCCNEIENASTEQIPNVLVLVKSAGEKDMNTSYSSSSVLCGDPDGFSMDRTVQSDDCSYNTVILSRPETWSLDATKVGKSMQQDDKLKLEESCVMVARDELQLVPKAGGNLKTNKTKRRQAFSLSKKSARKQEYEELARWHGNNEKRKEDCVENFHPTLLEDQKKLLLPNISEPEWELL